MAQNLQPYHIQQQTRRRSRLSRAFTAPTTNHEQPSSTPPLTFSSLPQLPPPQPLSSSSSSLQFQNVRDFPFNGHTMSLSPPNFNLNQPHYYYDTVSLLGDFFKQKRGSCEVMATSSVPFGPFTGYASILMRSRFLKPAQQILDDYCGGGGFYSEAIILSDFHNHHQLVDGFSETALLRDFLSFSDRIERSWKNSKLVFMLEEVQGMHSDAAKLKKASIWREASRIVGEEGFRAFWKGNLVTIAHRLPYSSVNFYAYEHYKKLLHVIPGVQSHRESVSADLCVHFVAGGLAGITAASATYPLDLVRTRLAAQRNVMYYKGIGHALQTICRDEGVLGLYKGLGATLLGVGPSIAISFSVYETLRSFWQSQRPDDSTVLVSLACGSFSGIASSTERQGVVQALH